VNVQRHFEILNPQPIKWLSSTKKRELEEQNLARQSCGLSPIKPKLRRCLACDGLFESIERRLCGCTDRQDSHVLGFEGV
jgi:hypothetical protein